MPILNILLGLFVLKNKQFEMFADA